MTSWIVTIPDHLKTEEMCDEAMHIEPLSLTYDPYRFRTQEMCDEAVHKKLCMILFVPNLSWNYEMCNKIMRTMSDAVRDDSSSLQFVPG